MDGHQGVVEGNDAVPVRVLRTRGRRMNRSDGSLDVIFSELRTRCGELQQLKTFAYQRSIPERPILREQRDQVAESIDTAGKPCRTEAHQRGESIPGWRCPRGMLQERRAEPHGLMAEFGPHCGLGRCSMVAL